MNKNSNTYTFIYSIILVTIVGATLSFLAIKLKPLQDNNVEVEKKQNILKALNISSSSENAEKLFSERINSMKVVNTEGEIIESVDAFEINLKKELQKKDTKDINLPIFIGTTDTGEEKIIVPLSGKGLWGPIWGYIAFNKDYNTIFGATFDHKAETPGLGAEINTKWFKDKFITKSIFNDSKEFVSIKIEKGVIPPTAKHKVDAISGGTITSKGVEKMLADCLELYIPYFESQK